MVPMPLSISCIAQLPYSRSVTVRLNGHSLQPSAYPVSLIVRIWLQELNIVLHGMYTTCILFTCVEWLPIWGSLASFDSVKLKPWNSGLRTLFHILFDIVVY